jgi:enamine deaminase RidA (YjgF/YER057c/UK114 family)
MLAKNGKLLRNLWQTAETKGKIMAKIAARLKELGIEVPPLVPPVASYVPYVKTGNLVFVSGQVPVKQGKLEVTGLLGAGVTLEEGAAQARQCAINILAALNHACDGDLDRIRRIVKLTGFVASAPTFTDHPKVINGASDFFGEVFGDAGKHARAAVGVACLPLNACVEVEAVVELH